MAKPGWDEFYRQVRAHYWPALAPDERVESRPRPTESDPHVPDDIWQVALLCFPSAEAWLSNPVPDLDGRTPLEALTAGEEARLRAILVDVAPFFLPDPSEVRPWEAEEG